MTLFINICPPVLHSYMIYLLVEQVLCAGVQAPRCQGHSPGLQGDPAQERQEPLGRSLLQRFVVQALTLLPALFKNFRPF
jgi:hypothetical protein